MKWFLISLLPSYWIQIHMLSIFWDAKLNKLIDNKVPFTNIDPYKANIGGYTVWIANHPYGSFSLHHHPHRPRRRTIARAKAWLDECIVNNP